MTLALSRCLSCLCLCFALALMGAYGVLACPLSNAVTAIVICGASGPETLYLGADGQPARPPQHGDCATCPACMAGHGKVVLPAQATVSLPSPYAQPSGEGRPRASWSAQPVFIPAARAPPVPV